jgi:hypothetical protein
MVNKSLKRAIVISLIIILAIGGLTFGFSYLSSFQKVTINPPAASQVTLYKIIEGGEEQVNYDKNSVILSGSEKTSKKIKKGDYVYVLSPQSQDYKSETVPINVRDQPVNVSPELKLTDTKLETIAQAEAGEVKNILSQKYPKTMQSYSVDKVRAYGKGEWIGITLSPNVPSLDVMVAIFKNNNGQLSLITDPPSIIISHPVYPGIPADVISNTNDLAQNSSQ